MKKGKRIVNSYKGFDRTKLYSLDQAVVFLQNSQKLKFDETIELSINLNVNPKKAEQNIRSTTILPHGVGKTKRILVMAKGEKLKEAEEAGVDYSGNDDLISKIASGWFEFDVMIATPDMMKDLGKIGKTLGPRGLMPNPKSGTVTMEIKKAVEEIKSGKMEFRVDSFGILHICVGKMSFDKIKLLENIKSFVNDLLRLKPSTVKGNFIKSMAISSTMGPGIKLDLLELINR